MGTTTYFVALPFAPDENGELVAGEPAEAQSPSGAISRARSMAVVHGGAVAFSRSGDLSLGEFNDAVVLGRYGATPDDLAAYVSG